MSRLPVPGPLDQAYGMVEDLTREVTRYGDRLFDRHLRLAVTGLRRSGKTVFTTSLVHHLLGGYDLAFVDAVHDRRFLGAEILGGHTDPFPFERFEEGLRKRPPLWPKPTEALSTLRLELRFRGQGWFDSLLRPHSSFHLDIIDYPGEWLLDLPLLQTDFVDFCRLALKLAQSGPRAKAARTWLDGLDGFDLADLLRAFRDYLAACQHELGMAFIQPGRLVHDFDSLADAHAFCPLPLGHRFETEMCARYERYITDLVRPFYTEHFANFDRQIVLVDLLSCLNAGPDHFADTQRALSIILESFAYGGNSWFQRLFAPRIDRVLFAASKADHVAGNQHANLKQLLELMVRPALQRARFDGIRHDVIALAALRSTDTVKTEHQGQTLSCVRGRLKNEERETVLFPGEIPGDLPDREDWENGIFRFYDFAPRPLRDGRIGQHIRLDQAVEFLIGDKLQ